ncbi:uncharacterized protein LOC143234951 [Tachypleus tridentatus]|uniref:uncharacterized protein LOC143234951 n=1 Tax=Tachypleus tridentatus TaxID=6853 RepID=UPI003FD1F4C0
MLWQRVKFGSIHKRQLKLPPVTCLVAYSTVGTPDYIASEVFIKSGYSNATDTDKY